MKPVTEFKGAWVQSWVFIHAEEFEDKIPTEKELRDRANDIYAIGSDDNLEVDLDAKISWLD